MKGERPQKYKRGGMADKTILHLTAGAIARGRTLNLADAEDARRTMKPTVHPRHLRVQPPKGGKENAEAATTVHSSDSS